MQYFIYIINILELSAAIVALINYEKYKFSTERYFLPFLWFVFFLDFSCGILVDFFSVNIYTIYNAFTAFSLLFYYNWYHSILSNKLNKKLTFLFSFILVIFVIIDLVLNKNNQLLDHSFVVGSIFIVILTGLYFYQLANTNNSLSIKYKLSFWIALAIILFYVGMIPFMLLSKYFNIARPGSKTFIIILISLNLIFYGCYIVGFIWTKKKYNHF